MTHLRLAIPLLAVLAASAGAGPDTLWTRTFGGGLGLLAALGLLIVL